MPNHTDHADITQWLASQPTGRDAPATGDRLFALLYDELRRIARSQMRHECADHTLSATALAHEAWFRLAEQSRTQWRNRSHFLAVAATMMRRILVNHAEALRAAKRDADLVDLTLSELQAVGAPTAPDLLAANDALLELETLDPRAARVVELKFFGGMELDEIAQALDVSLATVKRDWTIARAFLRRALAAD